MRSAKIGDVYAVRVPNGYKLVQWDTILKSMVDISEFLMACTQRFQRILQRLLEVPTATLQACTSAGHTG